LFEVSVSAEYVRVALFVTVGKASLETLTTRVIDDDVEASMALVRLQVTV